MKVTATLAVAVLALAACSGGDDGGGDASAKLACRHFRNVAYDYSEGLLTDAELRDKLREVHDDARVSEEPGIAPAARDMLAAATAGNVPALNEAVGRFGDACRDIDL